MKWIIIRKLERKGIGVTGGGTHRETSVRDFTKENVIDRGPRNDISPRGRNRIYAYEARRVGRARDMCIDNAAGNATPFCAELN